MHSAAQSLLAGAEAAPELPRVPHLRPLYDLGCTIPAGDPVMVCGRSGTMKSLFVMWLCHMLGLPTIYFSADMNPRTVGFRLAAMATGHTTKQVKAAFARKDGHGQYVEALASSPISWEYDSPITWAAIDQALDAHVEVWDAWPRILVIDNLMDVEGAAADYTAQMDAMQGITELTRDIGCTTIILHHASDKPQSKQDPWKPPARSEVKGGMSEKPGLSLSVALDPQTNEYRIAVTKNRHGPSDPSAQTWASLYVDPDTCRFYPSKPVPGSTASLGRY
ncbi:AAA family ATPase [Salininema proteolyticum]|uniref:AAA family ATPase n=1 Tax=Salininema proteolyticum TaxID=1607685 RepID=A0ABV8TZW3_9ACTN